MVLSPIDWIFLCYYALVQINVCVRDSFILELEGAEEVNKKSPKHDGLVYAARCIDLTLESHMVPLPGSQWNKELKKTCHDIIRAFLSGNANCLQKEVPPWSLDLMFATSG